MPEPVDMAVRVIALKLLLDVARTSTALLAAADAATAASEAQLGNDTDERLAAVVATQKAWQAAEDNWRAAVLALRTGPQTKEIA